MKDSKKFGPKVLKMYRALKKKYPKVEKVTYDEPVDAIIFAIIAERLTESDAHLGIRRFGEHFVDFNDLRVSRAEEIIEVLGHDGAAARDAALMITRVLMAVFEKFHAVSLEPLKNIGKRPAKQILEKVDGMTPFVINYCTLTSLNGHAVPLTERMIDYLRYHELVHPDADDQEIEGFLTRLISATIGYEFYAFLKHESEIRRPKRRKKKKTAVKPKTVKKTKTKKKKATRKKKTGKQ